MLRAVSERDAYANLALPALLRERGITGRDAAFATELAYGTCRTRGLLDAIICKAADRPPEKINPVLLDLLRLGAYQLLRTRVEQHAAVSTTVEQAGIEFDSARAGFVNGVLRTIAGRDEQTWVDELAPPVESDPVGHAAFVHAHPRWVAQAFADALGADAGQLDALLASDDERPSVHLAARPGVLTADELAGQVNGTVGRYSPYAVYLPGGDPGRLDPVRDGAALVQDEGSQLVARALTLADLDGPDTGRWLDLCAGPGGKTALLAALRADESSTESVQPPPLPRSSPPRGAPTWSKRTPAACRSRYCASTAATPGSKRASTGCWSTHRAPDWVRCGAGQKPAGGASPEMSRSWPNCRKSYSPRRSG